MGESPIDMVEAYKHLATRFGAALLIGLLASVLAEHFFGIRPDHVATAGVQHVSIRAIHAASSAGVHASWTVFWINATVALMLLSWPLAILIHLDPQRTTVIRRFFRSGAVESLVKAHLRSFPTLGVIVFGLIIGAVIGTSQFHPNRFESMMIAVGFIAPHGVFEIAAILLAGSLPLSAYFSVREDLKGGSEAYVFDRLRALCNSKAALRTIAAILILLAAAAAIEMNWTARVGSWLASAL